MKRFTYGLGVVIASVALTASPALAQRPAGGGGSGVRTGGGGGGETAAPRGGGGGGGAATSSSAGSSGSMNSGSSSSSSSMSSPSAPAAMAPTMSRGSAAAPRQVAPAHRSAGWSGTSQGRYTGVQHTANGIAIPRSDSSPVTGAGVRPRTNPDTRAVPGWARTWPGGGGTSASSDSAIPRTTPRPQPGNNLPLYNVYPGYWGCHTYGGDCGGPYGYYDGYYGGYYDPYYGSIYSPFFGYGMGLGLGGYPIFDSGASDYDYGVGSYSPSQYGSREEGDLKLKVKPRSATVYVDGYYVGVVDEFDGMFQKLPLTAGRHHVKIEADGYQTQEFDAVITPEQTVTFQGTLKKVQ